MWDEQGELFRNNDDILKYFYEPDISDFSDGDVFVCDFNHIRRWYILRGISLMPTGRLQRVVSQPERHSGLLVTPSARIR